MSDFEIRPRLEDEDFNKIAPSLKEDKFDEQLVLSMNKQLHSTPWNGWFKTAADFKDMPAIGQVTLKCLGKRCKYADVCPILRELSKEPATEQANIKELLGKPCRADLLYASQLFIGLAKELQLKPEDTIDVLTVVDIVRIRLLMRRMDWDIGKEGNTLDIIGGIDQKSGMPHYNLHAASHPLWKELDNLRKALENLTKQLNASRADKLKAAATMNNIADTILKMTAAPKKFVPPKVIDTEVKE